ncbi:alpha,alpha-trehalase TreF [Arsenicibacter rosenii]|uniref:Trehalase n=1 Tax=Arsenicibacter rosenii TaxID=1750698 RepID=A0A1S2VN46_9BACT|nr:alpha,alpha-trehalase TreF [Arsenicibacter rosenii]OIN60202.1 trehalase [Arsenicibacter rosenii]
MSATVLSPAEQLGSLFDAVQMRRIFPDSKTFADSLPLQDPAVIYAAYLQEKDLPGFCLEAFVQAHFALPHTPQTTWHSDATIPTEQHIDNLWNVLTRPADQTEATGSLLPLPYPYVVPGGRFREIYYWDSYFTMLGLLQSGKHMLIESMIANFGNLIDRYGFIPNGNRSYYLSRSQPPFFSLMVRLLSQWVPDAFLRYHHQLEREYAFWMNGNHRLTAAAPAYRRVVRMPDGSLLNRYYDDSPTPRPESYPEDIELAHTAGQLPETIYRHIRAAAESGWDFSSRWFTDGQSMATIATTDILPVDLNCLLWHLEQALSEASQQAGDLTKSGWYQEKAASRRTAILAWCWDEQQQFFMDVNLATGQPTPVLSLAGVFPLFFGLASADQAGLVHQHILQNFLHPGGVVTTLAATGQQWDAPNGWAPLQWLTVQALSRYGFRHTARTIQRRWLAVNDRVFRETGKMMEKYNVVDEGVHAGGGEYPTQDGFGWSNSIYLDFLRHTIF